MSKGKYKRVKVIPSDADCYLECMYAMCEMSIPVISDITGYSMSSIRARLELNECLRTRSHSIQVAKKMGRQKSKYKGVKRGAMPEETKQKISARAVERWKGKAKGVTIKPCGYIEYTTGENKFKLQHRVIMEKQIGRPLLSSECVHHKDGNKLNNDISNLEIMTWEEHARHHALQSYKNRKRNKYGQFK